jgi:hypothetical protein
MNDHDEHDDITFSGRVGPKVAATIGAVAGFAASRRHLKGAVVGGAVGWALAHFLNRRQRRKSDVVDVTATESTPPSGEGTPPAGESV